MSGDQTEEQQCEQGGGRGGGRGDRVLRGSEREDAWPSGGDIEGGGGATGGPAPLSCRYAPRPLPVVKTVEGVGSGVGEQQAVVAGAGTPLPVAKQGCHRSWE